MKKFLVPLFVLFLSAAVFAQGNTNVVFRVDMRVAIKKGLFKTATDSLSARGDFQIVAGDVANWSYSALVKLSPESGDDSIYTVTVTLPNTKSDTTFNFKFVQNDGGWENIPSNRTFTLDTSSATMTLPKYFFGNDSVFTPPKPIYKNIVKFTANLTNTLGSGFGFFDPSTDSIQVAGLDWDGLGVVESGNRVMIQDPFQPNIFAATMTFRGTGLSDTTKWKFKANPGANFTNGGWEVGPDRWYKWSVDTTSTLNVGPIVPGIFPVQAALTADVDVTFQVDMNGAKDVRNGMTITNLQFVGMRGGASFLGDWTTGGNWDPTDTVGLANMLVLYDDGTHGDFSAGDNIWTLTVTVPTGTAGGFYEYKFGAWYTGTDSLNSGSVPMDNEMGFGVNHSLILKNGSAVTQNHLWALQPVITGVERLNSSIPDNFNLSQNYPNPFNPSTLINYSIPQPGLVTLKIYDMLGREVATLVNTQQAAGTYKVSFDASQLASGVYFYRINTNNFIATKKMLLMK